jgi:hypothetical protein
MSRLNFPFGYPNPEHDTGPPIPPCVKCNRSEFLTPFRQGAVESIDDNRCFVYLHCGKCEQSQKRLLRWGAVKLIDAQKSDGIGLLADDLAKMRQAEKAELEALFVLSSPENIPPEA